MRRHKISRRKSRRQFARTATAVRKKIAAFVQCAAVFVFDFCDKIKTGFAEPVLESGDQDVVL